MLTAEVPTLLLLFLLLRAYFGLGLAYVDASNDQNDEDVLTVR